MKEYYDNPPEVHSKTVYNFVQRIRKIEGISKCIEKQPRDYEKLPDSEYGHQAQVDFGEYSMRTKNDSRIAKVLISIQYFVASQILKVRTK